MLELQNLSRNFRGIPAIESVSFKVAPGEIVGFLGPNGAGKTTTVKIITGMLRPNEGRVLFEGQDVRKDMVAFRSAFGYVPEEAYLYNYLSGLEYLQLVGRLRGLGEQLDRSQGEGAAQTIAIGVVAVLAHLFILQRDAPAGADRRRAPARPQAIDLR